TDKESRFKLKQKDTDQLQLMLGFPAYNYDSPNLPALEILNNILGANMSSRLFINIREELGLAYSIRSGVSKYTDLGHLYIKAGLDTDNIDQAITEIKNVVGNLSTGGVEKHEYKDAKTNIEGKMKLRMEDSKSKAMWFGRRAVCREQLETPKEHLNKIKNTSKEEVDKIAKEVFDLDLMRIAVIGDTNKELIKFL
ncbi:MAG: hypothetical protein BRC22_01295, partial [Parcubacteria group bacterium QH_9_35_7]